MFENLASLCIKISKSWSVLPFVEFQDISAHIIWNSIDKASILNTNENKKSQLKTNIKI